MTSYRNFKYKKTTIPEKWKVVYPSGFSTFIYAKDEKALQGMLDDVIEMFEG